ncbi:hypothetical protein CHS0354_022356 [Potamilus streckersoni]|uniref:Uncharacterized protein n=1 Tax=Potamilus streckersoni TaxID=2493646 RepID=A0AAE0W6Y0_9BIVA|nr:hypothetical protein CHS0354_022356 [Potamilus streckersoni]
MLLVTNNFKLMYTILIWAFIVVCSPFANGQDDCQIRATHEEYFYQGPCYYYLNYNGNWDYTSFSCGNDYKCCDNGCCPVSSETSLSDMETVGVVLSATAMFTIIVLALMIFGITFCDGRNDESKIFGQWRTGSKS